MGHVNTTFDAMISEGFADCGAFSALVIFRDIIPMATRPEVPEPSQVTIF